MPLEKQKQFENSLEPRFKIQGSEGQTLLQRMADLHVPAASVAVIKEGKLDWSKLYHQEEKASSAKDQATIFQAASISKIFTAVLAMKTLVETGKIQLDENLNPYLQKWGVANPYPEESVTLRRLLSHTAGINVRGLLGYSSDLMSYPDLPKILKGNETLGEDLREPRNFPHGETNHPPIQVVSKPGAEFSYSGGGFTLIQKLIEEQTGKPFATLAKELLFDPLDMHDSTFESKEPTQAAATESILMGHDKEGNLIKGSWRIHPELGAAGLWSTSEDLAKFVNAILHSWHGENDDFLKQQTIKDMLRTQEHSLFGLGFELYHYPDTDSLAFGHGGSNMGYKCQIKIFPEANAAFVIMTNGDNGTELIEECENSLLQTYQWARPLQTVKEVVSLSEDNLKERIGDYQYEYKGQLYPLKLTWEDNKIFITIPFPSFDSKESTEKLELLSESPHSFFNSQYKMTLKFDEHNDTAIYFDFPVKKMENPALNTHKKSGSGGASAAHDPNHLAASNSTEFKGRYQALHSTRHPQLQTPSSTDTEQKPKTPSPFSTKPQPNPE